ncbi:YHS domain-containing protein [Tolypothrix campylonemoides VB511288]|nr:YHS domain-containing protein [Tolypothrix campylonemoides VB511288]
MSPVRSPLARVVLALALSLMAFAAFALDPVNTGFLGDTAIKGYDTVAYHTERKPVKGSERFTATYMGATWRFASAANRDLFKANPARYAPQYGGYCAYAVGNNYTAGIDPSAFSVVGDKLYLNYSPDIQKQWLGKRDAYIRSGDANWPKLLRAK